MSENVIINLALPGSWFRYVITSGAPPTIPRCPIRITQALGGEGTAQCSVVSLFIP